MSDIGFALNFSFLSDTEVQVTTGFVTGEHTPKLGLDEPYALDAIRAFALLSSVQEAAYMQAQLPAGSFLNPRSLPAGYRADWASHLDFGAVSNNTDISSVPAETDAIEDIYAFRRYIAAGAPATAGGTVYPNFDDMIMQKLNVLRSKLSPGSRWEERSELRFKHEKQQSGKMWSLKTTKDVKTTALIQQDLDKLWNRHSAERDAMEATFQNARRLQVECSYLPLTPGRQAVDFFVIYVWHYDDARLTDFQERLAEAWAKGVLRHQGLTFGTDTPIPCALEGLPIIHLCMAYVDADSAFQAGKVTKDHNVMIFDSGGLGEVCLKCLGPEGFRPCLHAAIDSFVAGGPGYESKMHTDQSTCCGKPVQISWHDRFEETFPVAGIYDRTKSKWQLTLTASFSIECKDPNNVIRTVELEEVVEFVEGPVRDPRHSLERIKVKALKDGVEGWITSKRDGVGDQPDQISMEKTSIGFYKCIKNTNKSQSDVGYLFLKGSAGRRSAFAQRECAIGDGRWADVVAGDDPAVPDFTTLIDSQQASSASASASSS